MWTKSVSTVLLCAALSACATTYQPDYAKDKNVKQMQNIQTVCAGRFLIDVPKEAVLTGKNATYDGEKPETFRNISEAQFKQRIATREAELKKTIYQGHTPLLTEAQSPVSNSRALLFRKEPIQILVGRAYESPFATEGYLWARNMMIVFKGGAGEVNNGKILPIIVEKLQTLSVRANNEIPKQPGFCFDGGFFMSPQYKNEFLTLAWNLPAMQKEREASFFSIEMRPTVKSDDKLLDRSAQVDRLVGDTKGYTTVLRRSNRKLDNLDGQELLIDVTAGGYHAYYFFWEARGQEETLNQPHTRIRLRLGGYADEDGKPYPAPLSQQETLDLWDAMLNSLRVRVNAQGVYVGDRKAGQSSEAEQVSVPPLASRTVVPVSGWYKAHLASVSPFTQFINEQPAMHVCKGEALPSVGISAEEANIRWHLVTPDTDQA